MASKESQMPVIDITRLKVSGTAPTILEDVGQRSRRDVGSAEAENKYLLLGRRR
jgi:hypothetical protein